ncbi:phosphoglycerate mutase family protein [Paenibacillus tyrfis]|nr:phosphoglycerate mutase family protein [Paenibacillus tyrfis]
MAIYFIRHGIDEEGFRGGWSQRGLIVEGYRQSEKLGSYLKENQSSFQLHRVVSSDLQRAFPASNTRADLLNHRALSDYIYGERWCGLIRCVMQKKIIVG